MCVCGDDDTFQTAKTTRPLTVSFPTITLPEQVPSALQAKR